MRRLVLFALLNSLLWDTTWAAEAPAAGPSLNVIPGAPSGFEDLSKPNTTAVDVSYGGASLGSFLATFQAGLIRFEKPEDILAKIPSIKASARNMVSAALSGYIPAHADALCQRIRTDGCGILTPDVAGVIFDENTFRASVFINRNNLDTQNAYEQKILPEPERRFSGVHSLNLAAVGTDPSAMQYSLLQHSIYAYGPARLDLSEALTNTSRSIENAAATMDRWGLESTAGFFDSHSSSLLPLAHIAGVSVGTSLNTNLDYRRSKGNDIVLFLPQRSWVSLMYRTVIYSTDIYEAGNQVIDTKALPDGAYEVTLRIRDISGSTREEKRFFVKNFEIPPAGEPIYYGQGGLLRAEKTDSTLPGFLSVPVARAGLAERLTDSTGLSIDALAVKSHGYLEGGIFKMLPPNQQLRLNGLLSTAGDCGLAATYLTSFFDNKLALNLDGRVIRSHQANASGDPGATGNIIGNPSEQLTAQLAYQATNNLALNLNGSYAAAGSEPAQFAAGPQMRYYVWRENANSLLLTADYTQTQSGPETSVMLNLSLRFGPWGLDSEASTHHLPPSGQNAAGEQNDAYGRVTWNDDQTPGKLTVIGAEERRTSQGHTDEADADYRSRWGQLKINAQHNVTQSASNNLMSGNFGFSLANTRDNFAWGGDHQEASALIADLGGNATSTAMKVMVDGAERASGQVGSALPVFLTPYQTYNVSLLPATGSRFVDYDGAARTTTLYPGNVAVLRWDVQNVNIVLGRLVDLDGHAITGATLREARNITVTDEDGRFQAELTSPRVLTFTREEKSEEEKAWEAGLVVRQRSAPGRYHRRHSPTTSPDLSQAILDIFEPEEYAAPTMSPWAGAPNQNPPSLLDMGKPQQTMAGTIVTMTPIPDSPVPGTEEPPVVTPQALSASAQIVPLAQPESLAPNLPARTVYVCKVTLPPAKDVNNVLMYAEPFTCNLSVEGKKPVEPPAKEQKG